MKEGVGVGWSFFDLISGSHVVLTSLPSAHAYTRVYLVDFLLGVPHIEMSSWETTGSGVTQTLVGSCLL